MEKNEFLDELRKRLKGLPKEDVEERINYYGEMIDDRVEDGKTEVEAVSDIGDIDDVIKDIAKDTPLTSLIKEKVRPKRRLYGWEILVLILGFPLWFPLLLVGIILFLVAIFVLWILQMAFYIVDISVLGASVFSILIFLLAMTDGKFVMMYLGSGLAGIGVGLLLILLSIKSTKIVAKITKNNIVGVKSWFIKGGQNEEAC